MSHEHSENPFLTMSYSSAAQHPVFCSSESEMQSCTLSAIVSRSRLPPHIERTLRAANCPSIAHPFSLPAGGLSPSLRNCTIQPENNFPSNCTFNGSPNFATYRAKLLLRQDYFSSGVYRHIQPTASLNLPNNWNVDLANYSYQHLQYAIQPEMKTTTQSPNNFTNHFEQHIPSFLDNVYGRNQPTHHSAPVQNSIAIQHVDSTGGPIPRVHVSHPHPPPARRLSRPRVSKPGKALLERLYTQKKLFAYPSREQCEELGRQCGLTARQVMKWFANKRARDDNTRTRTEVALGRRVHALDWLTANVTDTMLGH